MTNLFLSVTDLELIAGQAVKGVLVLVFSFVFLFNVMKMLRTGEIKGKALRESMALIFLLLTIQMVRWFLVEDSMLRHPAYTTGVTMDTCQVFAKGKGIEFEYEVEGKKYCNCNTYHPILLENIVVPGGRYSVRYSKKFPGKGRIDFHKKVEAPEK